MLRQMQSDCFADPHGSARYENKLRHGLPVMFIQPSVEIR
jgi:hypothetical protein